MEKILILLRGVPGSGKSTMARRIVDETPNGAAIHFEADMYFSRTGEYVFDPAALPEAHGWCQESVLNALKNPAIETVVVSNTFIKRWEVEPYLKMAKELGINVVIRRMTTLFSNLHGVPENRVKGMLSAMEAVPGEELVGA